VVETIPGSRIGIHSHNDTENAVANSLAALNAGARQVQGTLNGLGERCGNANLVSLIPTLLLKTDFVTGMGEKDLAQITKISRLLDERLNRAPSRSAAYVGESAFAHKGGLHVSAVEKDPRTYEHIEPALVGNRRHIVVSDQSGRANILARFRDIGLAVDVDDSKIATLVETVKAGNTMAMPMTGPRRASSSWRAARWAACRNFSAWPDFGDGRPALECAR